VQPVDPKDKQITRRDVSDYGRLVASALGPRDASPTGVDPQMPIGAST
jgi:hypothetical protein